MMKIRDLVEEIGGGQKVQNSKALEGEIVVPNLEEMKEVVLELVEPVDLSQRV